MDYRWIVDLGFASKASIPPEGVDDVSIS